METVLPKRKSHHLQGYDYSQNGAYFITICTHQRRMLFGPNRAPVGADSISARMAARVFREIIGQYPAVHCRYFVVMPNHFHALVEIERARADMESAPTTVREMGGCALIKKAGRVQMHPARFCENYLRRPSSAIRAR